MFSKDTPLFRHNVPRLFLPQVPCEELPVPPPGNETEVLTLGLIRDGKVGSSCDGPHLFFRILPKGKEDVRESFSRNAREEVRLVLFAVLWAPYEVFAVSLFLEGVVSSSKEIAPQSPGMGKELAEFEVAIAEDAGIWRPTPAVLGNEIRNDYILHFF